MIVSTTAKVVAASAVAVIGTTVLTTGVAGATALPQSDLTNQTTVIVSEQVLVAPQVSDVVAPEVTVAAEAAATSDVAVANLVQTPEAKAEAAKEDKTVNQTEDRKDVHNDKNDKRDDRNNGKHDDKGGKDRDDHKDGKHDDRKDDKHPGKGGNWHEDRDHKNHDKPQREDCDEDEAPVEEPGRGDEEEVTIETEEVETVEVETVEAEEVEAPEVDQLENTGQRSNLTAVFASVLALGGMLVALLPRRNQA